MNHTLCIKRRVCVLLLFAILLTLVFIFGNSMASPEKSGAASDKVNETVGEIIETVTGKQDSQIEEFFKTYSRKIAHVIEFALLGLEMIFLLHVAGRRQASHLLAGALFSFFVASSDEGIQILSGRGDMVSDIWLDCAGYIVTYSLGMLMLYLFVWRKKAAPPVLVPLFPTRRESRPAPVPQSAHRAADETQEKERHTIFPADKDVL